MKIIEDKIKDERIRWACRRGMLELDLFLVPFYEHCYQELSEKEKETFAELLTAIDPELLEWLMAHQTPQNKEVACLVEKIRAFRLHQRRDPIF